MWVAVQAVVAAGLTASSTAPSRPLIAPTTVTFLSGPGWKLGSFALGEGERAGAHLPGFADDAFQVVSVPGEVQRQIGLKDMELYYQGPEVTLVNQREWWYRKQFTVPPGAAGQTLRLVFEGVDYFCTVWLNGEELGDHEGAYVDFSYDVTSKLRVGSPNLLVVKVTCPWLPEGRGFLEYMKGELAEAVPGQVTEFPTAPYVLGPTWDGLPAGGNAAFPMGLFRDVKLVSSGATVVGDLFVATKSLQADGSATLVVSGSIRNDSPNAVALLLGLRIAPENFPGTPLDVPPREVQAAPGETTFSHELHVPAARLWWTWDTGEANLYRATATVAASGASASDRREVVFGIRTIERRADMSYWLNGRRIFMKGAWYPMSDQFGSKPTRETFETDLGLFRHANLNHLVNFTVVEKDDYYDLCDRLGLMNFVELPFIQFGPMAVMSSANPRRQTYVNEALSQVRRIVTRLRSHPSIVVWAPFAEAQVKGRGWGAAGHDFEQYGYEEFAGRIGAIVAQLAPGTIFHPSLCDAGEQHFWMGTAGPWRATPYHEQFQANTGFVSEYGAIALPALESLEKMLKPEELWSTTAGDSPQWHGLPIDVAAYSYQTSFDYIGLAGVLDRVRRFVDTDIKSAAELVEGSQLYQAFLLQYSTDVYRRRKYHSVNGTRIWAYTEPTPGIRFGFLDYYRVPKMGYYFLRRAQAPFAVNFAYEPALESQVVGKRLNIPVWVINDHDDQVPYDLECEITDLNGRQVWRRTFTGAAGRDSAGEAGVVDWTTPDAGVYMLQARAREKGGPREAVNRTFIKVVPRLFARPVRMLLIGHRDGCRPLALMAQELGVDVTVIDEGSIQNLARLQDSRGLQRDFDLVWLSSFDSFWKLLDAKAGEGLAAAIRGGLGFVHSGGPGSFHGGSIRAALLELTSLGDVLPVRVRSRDDLYLAEAPLAAYDTLMATSPVRDIHVAPGAPAGWAVPGWNDEGLAGFNRVGLKPGATQLVTVRNHPLVVAGRYGEGRVVAFTGFTPSWPERRSPWDRKMISTYQLDQELVAQPQARTCFALMMRLIAEALGEPPAVPCDEILAARTRPLFEDLQDLPPARLELPERLQVARTDGTGMVDLPIRNGSSFARLVRVRAEWDGSPAAAPYLATYDDNYFDLLPGESKTVRIALRMPPNAGQGPSGRLIVEGSNVKKVEIPCEPGRP